MMKSLYHFYISILTIKQNTKYYNFFTMKSIEVLENKKLKTYKNIGGN